MEDEFRSSVLGDEWRVSGGCDDAIMWAIIFPHNDHFKNTKEITAEAKPFPAGAVPGWPQRRAATDQVGVDPFTIAWSLLQLLISYAKT